MADTATVEQANNGTVTETQERKFSQAELDDIVKARVAKERAKYADFETLQEKALKFDEMEEANKTELQKATEKAETLQKQIDAMTRANEVRTIREKVSNETGVPISLLMGETEEACAEQAKNILSFKNDGVSYPTVKDSGEVSNVPNKPKTNGQMFGEFLQQNLHN